MKALYLGLWIFVSIVQVTALHLHVRASLAGRILMRAYNDPIVQEALKGQNVTGSKRQLKKLISQKIKQMTQRDPTTLSKLTNVSFPEGTLAKAKLTQKQKQKLLSIIINNPSLVNKPRKNQFLDLIGKQPQLRNVYDELLERRKVWAQVKSMLYPKVMKDPVVAAFIANHTNKSDVQYRKAFKSASASVISSDPQLQKIVASSQFGFDPVFSQLSEDQRIRLLNRLLKTNKTDTFRWKSPEYLREVSAIIQSDQSFKSFYQKNKDDIQNKIKLADERKVRYLRRKSQLQKKAHFNEVFEGLCRHRHLRRGIELNSNSPRRLTRSMEGKPKTVPTLPNFYRKNQKMILPSVSRNH